MTAYSNLINKTVADAISAEGFEARSFAPKVYDKISREDRKRTSIATITKDLRRAAEQWAKRTAAERVSAQYGFSFIEQLPGTVSVDADGHRTKFTLSLKEMEFEKANKRWKNSRNTLDTSIEAMDAAHVVAKPYWKEHPDWELGQCLEQAAKDRLAGEAA